MAKFPNPFRRRAGEIEQRSFSSPGAGGGGLTDPSAIPPYPGYGQQIAGVPVNALTALQVPAVFTAIRVICFTLGKLGDPRAFKEALSDDNIPYREWQAEQPPILANTFGGDIGGLMNYDGRNRTVASMALFGEAWWYTLEYDRLKHPTVVEPLNPLLLEIKEENGQKNYYYGTGKDRVKLDPARLHHIPLMAHPGADRGLSSVQYLGVVMSLALASLQFGSLYFSQGSSPSYLLKTPQSVSEPEANRLVKRFMVQHAGLQQSHLPLLLDRGLEAEKIMAHPDEAQFNQTLSTAYITIGAWFGIPPHLMGNVSERGNSFGAGATEEMMRQFESACLVGYVTALEEAYSRLLPDGLYAAFDTQRWARPNAQAQAMLISALKQTNSMTINEIRTRFLGLAPIEGGDDLVAPLASNTAPEQTEGNGTPDTDKAPPATTGPDART